MYLDRSSDTFREVSMKASFPRNASGRCALRASITCAAFAFVLLVVARGWGEEPEACTTENLLAGRAPSSVERVRRDAALITDGAITAEGEVWDAEPAVLM